MNQEYMFWINFNDWLSIVYDSYGIDEPTDDYYTCIDLDYPVDPILYEEVTE
jgi:hypothetical protein